MTQPHAPKVSVLIPNWNGESHLRVCFAALQSQSYANIETILIDNGSTDDSLSLTETEFPWVKILRLSENLGLTGALNHGIKHATGQIIVPLNNDTEVDSHWAEALVSALEKVPGAGMAASKMMLFDRRDTIHSAGDAFGKDGIPINRGVWQKDEGQFDDDTFIFGGCGGAVAYRRTMLDRIGGFDEDLFMYCEDVDLNWRAQLAGYQCVFAPDAVVYHKLSASGGGIVDSYFTGRNTIFVLAKSVPSIVWRNHRREIIGAQLKIAWDALRAWRGKEARARLRGQLAGIIGIAPWLRKRKAIQNTRQAGEAYLESLLEK